MNIIPYVDNIQMLKNSTIPVFGDHIEIKFLYATEPGESIIEAKLLTQYYSQYWYTNPLYNDTDGWLYEIVKTSESNNNNGADNTLTTIIQTDWENNTPKNFTLLVKILENDTYKKIYTTIYVYKYHYNTIYQPQTIATFNNLPKCPGREIYIPHGSQNIIINFDVKSDITKNENINSLYIKKDNTTLATNNTILNDGTLNNISYTIPEINWDIDSISQYTLHISGNQTIMQLPFLIKSSI